jgi:predicted AAA+ superfamily ATPase
MSPKGSANVSFGLWENRQFFSATIGGAAGDLSRRYVPIAMPLQSFREYLFVTSGVEYPTCDPFVSDPMLPLEPKPEILAAFRDYKAQGTRPFSAEGDFSERLLAVLDKTLYSDIPFFLPSVTDGNLRLMKAIVGTLAEASIPRLQVRSLCADWGIGADKLYQLLDVMESVGLLRMLRVEGDRKAKSVGAKMFFSDPAYYEVLHGNTGTAREAMVATLCAEAGWTVEATKEEVSGDFAISRREGGKLRRHMIEVGGASKRVKSADRVVRDDLDFPSGKAIPLWLLGMAY